jgi:transposase
MPKLLFARPPLDAVEERKIRKLAGARHAPADWIRRAQIIALSWDGLRVPAIAEALGCSQKAVRHRLARFAADGLDGLGDRPGAGRKPRISQAQRSRLIALVAGPPPGRLVRDGAGELVASDATGPAVWTLDALTAAARAAGIDIARSQVRRILLAEGVRWRRPRSWATSPDPEFVPKGRGSWTTTRTRRRTPRSLPPTSSAR